MRSSVLLLAGISLSSLLASSAVARPANVSDFSGKTICWSDGNKSTFHANGKLDDSIGGSGTWRFGAAGLEMHTASYTGISDVQIQPDGTYVSKGTTGNGGQTALFTAHICK
jgi:hypothetical protein